MTGFKSFHPFSEFIFFVPAICVSLFFTHPIVIGISLFCAIANDFQNRKSTALKSALLFGLPFVAFCAGFNALFSHYGVTILFTLFSGNNFTLESLVYGAVNGAKILCVIVWLNCFNEVITPEKFIYLFGRISPKTALVLSMSLRFIPLFRLQMKEISRAQKGLGAKNKSKFKSAVKSVSILITRELEKGIETANSMTARGYGSGKRSRSVWYHFNKTDVLFCVFVLISAVVAVIFFEKTNAIFNPIIKIPLEPIPLVITGIILFLCFFCPIIIDFTEKKRWNS